jgi:hypothetical protein
MRGKNVAVLAITYWLLMWFVFCYPQWYDDQCDGGAQTYPRFEYFGHCTMLTSGDRCCYLGFLRVNYTSASWNRTIEPAVHNWEQFPRIVRYIAQDTYGPDAKEYVSMTIAWYVPVYEERLDNWNTTYYEFVGYSLEWMLDIPYTEYEHYWEAGDVTLMIDFWAPI